MKQDGRTQSPLRKSVGDVGRRYDVVRWLEYSGLLVILGILADGQQAVGLSVTGLVDLSGLCTDTVYSALALALSLGLVQVQFVGTKPWTKRFSLTGLGRPLGMLVQQAREEMAGLPPPGSRLARARRPKDASQVSPEREKNGIELAE